MEDFFVDSINETNSKLYGNVYEIPEPILEKIQVAMTNHSTNRNGMRRAKFLLNNKKCTYATLKRLKNFFDYPNKIPTVAEFQLAGAEDMMNWVNMTLQRERDAVKASKQAKETNDAPLNLGTLKVQKDTAGAPDLNEVEEEVPKEEQPKEEPKQESAGGCTCILVTPQSKLLLLKRSAQSNWMPNKWAFVGGKINAGESPEDAMRREITEEVGLQVNRLIEKFSIVREGRKEYVYYTIIPADAPVKINQESAEFGFYTLQEIEKLDTVPNLIDYVSLVLYNKEYTGSIYDKSHSEEKE
jgi:8-oxo-dGTP pyrophosphatase MutT (NUDIX family)